MPTIAELLGEATARSKSPREEALERLAKEHGQDGNVLVVIDSEDYGHNEQPSAAVVGGEVKSVQVARTREAPEGVRPRDWSACDQVTVQHMDVYLGEIHSHYDPFEGFEADFHAADGVHTFVYDASINECVRVHGWQ